MGLGFGFCCCCILIYDQFFRATVGDQWSTVDGTWSISSYRLTTSDSNARINCAVMASAPYTVICQFRMDVGSVAKFFLGSLTIEVSRPVSVLYAKVFEGASQIGVQTTLGMSGGFATIYATVDGRHLYLDFGSNNFEAYTANGDVGYTVGVGSGVVASGTVQFAGFYICTAEDDCRPKRWCDGWTDGVKPARVYADINFIVSGIPVTCDCQNANGVWELTRQYAVLNFPNYECAYGVRPISSPACGVYAFGEAMFGYRKIRDGDFLAELLFNWYELRAGSTTWIWNARFGKSYSTQASPGWSDVLPLVSHGADPGGFTHCGFDTNYYGQSVEVTTS